MKLIDDLMYRISYRTKTKEELDIQKKKYVRNKAISIILSFCFIVTNVCLFKRKEVKAEGEEKLTSPVVSAEISNVKIVISDDAENHPNTQVSFFDLFKTRQINIIKTFANASNNNSVTMGNEIVSDIQNYCYIPFDITFDANIVCEDGSKKNISIIQSPQLVPRKECPSGYNFDGLFNCSYRINNTIPNQDYVVDVNGYCNELLFTSDNSIISKKSFSQLDSYSNLNSNDTDLGFNSYTKCWDQNYLPADNFISGVNAYYIIRDCDAGIITFTDTNILHTSLNDGVAEKDITSIPFSFIPYNATTNQTDYFAAQSCRSGPYSPLVSFLQDRHCGFLFTINKSLAVNNSISNNTENTTVYTQFLDPSLIDTDTPLSHNHTTDTIQNTVIFKYQNQESTVSVPVNPDSFIIDNISAYITAYDIEHQPALNGSISYKDLTTYMKYRIIGRLRDTKQGKDSQYTTYQIIMSLNPQKTSINVFDENGKYISQSDCPRIYGVANGQKRYLRPPYHYPIQSSYSKNIFSLSDMENADRTTSSCDTLSQQLTNITTDNDTINIKNLTSGKEQLYSLVVPLHEMNDPIINSTFCPQKSTDEASHLKLNYHQGFQLYFVPVHVDGSDEGVRYNNVCIDAINAHYTGSAKPGLTYNQIANHLTLDFAIKEQRILGQINRYHLIMDVTNKTYYKYTLLEGLNDSRKMLLKLMDMVLHNEVNGIYVTYRDRLTRFGYHYLEKICEYKGVQINVLNNEREQDVNKALVEDVMALIASFSGKLYGMRSHKKNKGAVE